MGLAVLHPVSQWLFTAEFQTCSNTVNVWGL
jgi:hypothetical protein